MCYLGFVALTHDWLIDDVPERAKVVKYGGDVVALENGLIRRSFKTTPNCATIALDNLMTGQSMLRAVKPEAVLEIGGRLWEVGGLKGQPDLAFLRRDWIDHLTSDPDAFHMAGYTIWNA